MLQSLERGHSIIAKIRSIAQIERFETREWPQIWSFDTGLGKPQLPQVCQRG